MIGQNVLKSQFTSLPKTVLLIGAEGSGRKTFARWLADTFKLDTYDVSSGVDEVREMIEFAYNAVEPTLYIIPCIEGLSVNAQNALLKVLEEPPKSAYFVLTATQENLVLSTILSRSQVYHMDIYTNDDIREYYQSRYPHIYDENIESYILDLCTCPGEVDVFLAQDIVKFVDYVIKVFDNIAKVSGANSFKIGSQINLADDKTKYNLKLFWRAFIGLCYSHYADNPTKYSYGISITSKALSELNIRGANKAMAFDTWVLKIREGWLDADN